MIVYRLTVPIDAFDDFTPLPTWLRTATPESTAWLLRAVLALADGAAPVGWRGGMAYLPVIAAAPDGEPVLVVKQDDDGATFLISAHPQPELAESYGGARATHLPARPIDPFDPPTATEIAEAMWRGNAGTIRDATAVQQGTTAF